MYKWISILWLSFMTAVLGEMAFFVLIDPQELYLMGHPVHWSPIAVYSVGFFMFWALTALTAFLTYFIRLPASAFNTPPAGKAGLHRVPPAQPQG